jgi:hypothetical protein
MAVMVLAATDQVGQVMVLLTQVVVVVVDTHPMHQTQVCLADRAAVVQEELKARLVKLVSLQVVVVVEQDTP